MKKFLAPKRFNVIEYTKLFMQHLKSINRNFCLAKERNLDERAQRLIFDTVKKVQSDMDKTIYKVEKMSKKREKEAVEAMEDCMTDCVNALGSLTKQVYGR